MERNYLFKGFCVDNDGETIIKVGNDIHQGDWKWGSIIDAGGKEIFISEPYGGDRRVLRETVCEYTDVLVPEVDDDGNENTDDPAPLFENDIVELTLFDCFGRDKQYICDVRYVQGCMMLVGDKDDVVVPLCYVEEPETQIVRLYNKFNYLKAEKLADKYKPKY